MSIKHVSLTLIGLLVSVSFAAGQGEQKDKAKEKDTANPIPPELVGKWAVVEGDLAGSLHEYFPDGKVIINQRVDGKTVTGHSTARVENKQITYSSRNLAPGGKEFVEVKRVHRIINLTAKDFVTKDEKGTIWKFRRASLVTGNEPGGEMQKELSKFQGTWTLVSTEMRGKAHFTRKGIDDQKLTIKKDRWTETRAGPEGVETTFKIDPTKDPKELDLVFKQEKLETVRPAIYKLEGDTLTVCSNNSSDGRPKEFKTSEKTASAHTQVWKRATK